MKNSVRIKVDSAGFRYPSERKLVFENLSFSVEEGEVLFLLGPNGTGKSTLLKTIMGFLIPERGRITLDGEETAKIPPPLMAKKIAYVPQSQVSPFPFRVKDIVLMGRSAHLDPFAMPGRRDEKAAWEAMKQTGILHLAERRCDSVSGGEWQLVLIARALTQAADILLLDEPTSHLDLGNQMKVLDVIGDLAERGITIVIATHFPDHALLHASTVAIIREAHMLGYGSPEETIKPEILKAAYGIEVHIADLSETLGRKICIPLSPKGGRIRSPKEDSREKILIKGGDYDS